MSIEIDGIKIEQHNEQTLSAKLGKKELSKEEIHKLAMAMFEELIVIEELKGAKE